MKRLIILVASIYSYAFSIAQNVGIGTNVPAARLDIRKGGADTPTLNIWGSVNISYFNLGTNEDTYIRGGKATSHVILNDLGSGLVGIGMSTPGFPLNFPASLGDKISLWGSSGSHYGFGIQSGRLQIHSDLSSSDIVFGYGSSSSFTENLRIRGNGFVGIGTASPANRLDVAGLNNWDLVNTEGDMRIGNASYRLKFGVALGGGGAGAAGIMQTGGINLLSLGSNGNYQMQINGTDNSVTVSNNALLKFPAALSKKIIFYPGSTGDAHIGVYSNELRISSDYSGADITFGYDNRTTGFTEKFRMKANGAFVLNGNAGQPGQVLASTGGGANSWVNVNPSFYSFKQTDYQLPMTAAGSSPGEPASWYVVGGLHNQTITLNQQSNVMIQARVPIENTGNTFGGTGTAALYVGLYDASNNYIEFDLSYSYVWDGGIVQAVGFNVKNLPAGTYHTHVKIRRFGGDDLNTGGYYTGLDHGTLVVQVTSQ